MHFTFILILYKLKFQFGRWGYAGFANPHGYCCGHLGDYNVDCGRKAMVNGTEIIGASCSNPSEYISWDGVHYSHAANKWIANQILNGKLSNPPIPITGACHKLGHS